MDANEENKRGTDELKDEELEEVAGGGRTAQVKSYCPTCKRYFFNLLETCPQCKWDGVTSYLVPV